MDLPMRTQCRKEWSIHGYFTVEAAMLFPLVLGIVLLVIYLMIYRYNVCILEQETAILALRGIQGQRLAVEQTGTEVLEELQQQAAAAETEQYVAMELSRFTVGMSGYRIRAEGEGQVRIPFVGLGAMTGEEGWQLEVCYENRLLKPVPFIRICRRLEN